MSEATAVLDALIVLGHVGLHEADDVCRKACLPRGAQELLWGRLDAHCRASTRVHSHLEEINGVPV